MNPYRVLGVDQKAGNKQIKAAYRRLSALHHPDKPTGDIDQFHELQAAYDILGDSDRRKRYDATGRTDEFKATPQRVQAFIETTMHSVIEAQRPDGSSDDPVFENIRDKILATMIAARVEIKNQLFRTQRKLERCQRMVDRFKPRADFDPVGLSLSKEKDRLQAELHRHEDALELSIEVERVLKTYDYEVGPGPEGQYSPGPTIRPAGGYRLTSSRRQGFLA
jgi:curved DNA-binding protein CbpA